MSRQQMSDNDYDQILRTQREYLDSMRRLVKGGYETMKADKGREADDMGLTASNKGGDYKRCPAYSGRAIGYGCIDLGTQEGHYGPKHQCLFMWELTDELMDDGRPFAISKRYTVSLNEKSNLRHDLESWRGRAFTPEELSGFDLPNVVGAPCLLNVIEEPRRDGQGMVTKIASVSKLPKGMEAPTQVNPSIVFDMDAPDADAVYAKLPEWIQRVIAESAEWQAKTGGQTVAPPEDGAPSLGVPADDMDMDIPF